MKNLNIIPAGEFKAKCLSLMDKVYQTHTVITITKHGKPIAKLVPIDEKPMNLFGCLKGTATVIGDILAPLNVDWEVNE